MILENLLVNNFGVYNGRQNFNLTTDKKTSYFNWRLEWKWKDNVFTFY